MYAVLVYVVYIKQGNVSVYYTVISVQLFVGDRPLTEDSLLPHRRGTSPVPSLVAVHRCISFLIV